MKREMRLDYNQSKGGAHHRFGKREGSGGTGYGAVCSSMSSCNFTNVDEHQTSNENVSTTRNLICNSLLNLTQRVLFKEGSRESLLKNSLLMRRESAGKSGFSNTAMKSKN